MTRPKTRQRRLRGTGSVSVRKDGRWEGRWQALSDGSGQRPWVRVYALSALECDGLLEEAIRDYKRGRDRGGAHEPVGDYLERWMAGHVARLKPSTQRSYRTNVDEYLKPCVGSILLGDLRRSHLQSMVNTVADTAGTRSAGSAHATLRSALNDLDDGIIDRNPCEKVHVPTYRRQVPRPWQLDEAEAFVDGIKDHPDEALYLISTFIGTRPYEVLALTDEMVNLETGELRIEYGIQWVAGGAAYLDSVKSEAGHRSVRMAPRVLEALRAHLERRHGLKEAAGDNWIENGLVFTERNGRPRRIDTMNKRFHRIREQLGLRRVRLYDLRRLASAMMVKAAGMEAAQKTLGQSSIRVTMEMYDYQLEETAVAVARGVSDLFDRGSGSNTPSATPSGPTKLAPRRRSRARKSPSAA